MTVFDLEKSRDAWFELEGGGRVLLHLLSADEWNEIKVKTTTISDTCKFLGGKWERFEIEKVDANQQNRLFWDKIIVNWEYLYDKNGNEIPCTIDNKLLLLNKSLKFIDFINSSLEHLRQDEIMHQEVVEKN